MNLLIKQLQLEYWIRWYHTHKIHCTILFICFCCNYLNATKHDIYMCLLNYLLIIRRSRRMADEAKGEVQCEWTRQLNFHRMNI